MLAAADLVVVVHFAFILFGMFGGLLALRWRWMPWIHLPALAWAAWIELTGRICPLTPLENRLRQAAGEAGYGGDFIDRYVAGLVYPEGLTREIQLLLAVVLMAINAGVYAIVWRRRPPPGG
jgi:hypothetical protein